MKTYKLLKDLPFAKAGEIFLEGTGKRNGTSETTLVSENHITIPIWKNDIEDFNEWFEEIGKYVYFLNRFGSVERINAVDFPGGTSLLKDVGNDFGTQEEAEKYADYLKAKAIIKQDIKGFKPNWKNCENKYYGYWDFGNNSLGYLVSYVTKYSDICFKTEEDIKESFEKHPKEWKTYLAYEQ